MIRKSFFYYFFFYFFSLYKFITCDCLGFPFVRHLIRLQIKVDPHAFRVTHCILFQAGPQQGNVACHRSPAMRLDVTYVLILLLPLMCWATPTPAETKTTFSIPSNYTTESLGKLVKNNGVYSCKAERLAMRVDNPSDVQCQSQPDIYSEKFLWRVRKCLIYQKVKPPQDQAKAVAPQDRIAWCYPPSEKINGFSKVQKTKSDIY
ncbi:hypothetical protein MAPG_05335 [Magnaporthiopsis poae ATCC 64411]|uniref:Uncharacterized protein n=1 Tax=Magnaporthiopsis poae (strain ATCC 64411 / 73-15) TaxID=644358 RepID=A0A0C4DZ46_MAGP6|nr:hypothetical protein MAPG_05335 [Magnaporthiopsis poae ATCC 64411]